MNWLLRLWAWVLGDGIPVDEEGRDLILQARAVVAVILLCGLFGIGLLLLHLLAWLLR